MKGKQLFHVEQFGSRASRRAPLTHINCSTWNNFTCAPPASPLNRIVPRGTIRLSTSPHAVLQLFHVEQLHNSVCAGFLSRFADNFGFLWHNGCTFDRRARACARIMPNSAKSRTGSRSLTSKISDSAPGFGSLIGSRLRLLHTVRSG
jgi:hypothetical protein